MRAMKIWAGPLAARRLFWFVVCSCEIGGLRKFGQGLRRPAGCCWFVGCHLRLGVVEIWAGPPAARRLFLVRRLSFEVGGG